MPIPGTKGQGEIILNYMNDQRKSDCNGSCRGGVLIQTAASGQVRYSQEGSMDSTSVPCRLKNRKSEEVLDPAMEKAREELRCWIENYEDGLAERTNNVMRIMSKFPQLCRQPSGPHGRLPLHMAVKNKVPLRILEYLLPYYPKALVTKDYGGETPLSLACKTGHCEPAILRLLACPEAMSIRDKNGNTILHSYLDSDGLHVVNMQVLRQFVDVCPENLKVENNLCQLPLHVAIKHVHRIQFPILGFLAESYPEAVRTKDLCCSTPMHVLCDLNPFNNAHVLELLIEVCPQAVKVTNQTGSTPFHLLCKHSDHSLIRVAHLMLQACPQIASMVDRDFCLPLHLYCQGENDEQDVPFMELLLNANLSALTMKDSMDCTPLDRATKYSSPTVIRFLANKLPPGALEPSFDGGIGTPLHTLCGHSRQRTGFLESLQILAISERAVLARDYRGRTPCHVLAEMGGLKNDALQILMSKFPGVLLERDTQGRLPLHLAVEGSIGCDAVAEQTRHHHHDTVQCLLDTFPGAVRAGDKYGTTPLQLACENDACLSLIYQLVSANPIANLGLESGRMTAASGQKRKRVLVERPLP